MNRSKLRPNSEETANLLYGPPELEWGTDLSLLSDLKSRTRRKVNTEATFQKKSVKFEGEPRKEVLVRPPAKIIVASFEPPQGVRKVVLPKFKTVVEPKETAVKKPLTVSQKDITISMKSAKNVSTVLGNIDSDKLIPGRVGANKTGYSLNELKLFAGELGIATSGKSKKQLIDALLAFRKERGLE